MSVGYHSRHHPLPVGTPSQSLRKDLRRRGDFFLFPSVHTWSRNPVTSRPGTTVVRLPRTPVVVIDGVETRGHGSSPTHLPTRETGYGLSQNPPPLVRSGPSGQVVLLRFTTPVSSLSVSRPGSGRGGDLVLRKTVP